MFVTQDNPAVLWLEEINAVDLAHGFGSGRDGNKAKLSRGSQNGMAVGWIERLNLVEKERHSAIVAAQLILQEKQVEEDFDGDGCAMRLDLPKIVVSVPFVISPSHGEADRKQVGEPDQRIVLDLASEVRDCGFLLRILIEKSSGSKAARRFIQLTRSPCSTTSSFTALRLET